MRVTYHIKPGLDARQSYIGDKIILDSGDGLGIYLTAEEASDLHEALYQLLLVLQNETAPS